MSDPLINTLYLIFHGRFPGEKAAAVFAAESAQAFADNGFSVTVVVPRRLARLKESVEQCYGIKGNFRTVFVPILDLFEIPLVKTMAFKISYSTFSISTFFYILFSAKRRHTVIYSNESLPLLLLSFFFPNTFYEVHDFPRHSLNRNVMLKKLGFGLDLTVGKQLALLFKNSEPFFAIGRLVLDFQMPDDR